MTWSNNICVATFQKITFRLLKPLKLSASKRWLAMALCDKFSMDNWDNPANNPGVKRVKELFCNWSDSNTKAAPWGGDSDISVEIENNVGGRAANWLSARLSFRNDVIDARALSDKISRRLARRSRCSRWSATWSRSPSRKALIWFQDKSMVRNSGHWQPLLSAWLFLLLLLLLSKM